MLHPDLSQFDIQWKPHPGSQTLALGAPVNDILYCGTRGPGKTDAQLMDFRKNVGMGYGAFWRGIIFDREYKNLDDLVTKSKRWFYGLDDGAKFLESKADYKWSWPTGEELLFRVVAKPDDYWAYHGHEYPFIGWNELTKYANVKLYDKMMSVNRTGFDPEKNTPRRAGWRKPEYEGDEGFDTHNGKMLPPIPLRVFSTCNPHGVGHNWVKRKFIDVAPYGKILRNTVEVFNPKTKKDELITRTQTTVFGSWRENPNLDPVYIATLFNESDENVRKAWKDGNWDIVAGGAIDDVWERTKHVIPQFQIPDNWTVERCLDWGSSHPFSVGWFTEANGEEITLVDGRRITPPRGTIIQIAEWYGTREIGTNEGLKMSAKNVALGIIEREDAMRARNLFEGDVEPGPADNQIANINDSGQDTIEKVMNDHGVFWEKSDKSKGTRKTGLQLIRDRLEATKKGEGPGLMFVDICKASISTIPILPRDKDDPDDIDTDAEDHPYDMLRYRVLKGNNRTAKVIPFRLTF